jgi:two-component system, NtrC family, response regulator GlrR
MEKATLLVLYPQGMVDSAQSLVSALQQATGTAVTVVQACLDPAAGQVRPGTIEACSADMAFIFFDNGGMDWAEQVVRSFDETPVIGVMDEADDERQVSLSNWGFADFIVPPFYQNEAIPRLLRLIEKHPDDEAIIRTLKEKLGLKQLIGESESFLSEVRKIPRVASCDATVLISGETGTGKELFARAVHYLSPRHGRPFVPFNCGGVPPELFENELFGHLKGAFTGADATQGGLISEAEGGTLFLDEIDSLPLPAQAKFLRFLQSKEYRQLGSRKTLVADVRVVAASNGDLHRAVEEGKFRSDLFYRINVIPLCLPALRDRLQDISLLANHFVEKHASGFGRPRKGLAPEAIHLLRCHCWPGNVRELESVIERALIFGEGPMIQASDIAIDGTKSKDPTPVSWKAAKARAVALFEKGYLEETLRMSQGNITRAACHAQMNRRAFWELLRKHKIDRPGL